MTPTIRAAGVADAWAIAAVHEASRRAAYRHLLPEEYLAGVTVDERGAAWTRMLGENAGVTLVAEGPQGIEGFAHAGHSRDPDGAATGEIWSLYVHPGSWGKRRGSDLLAEAQDWLRHSYAQATLWVLAANSPARAFYARRGWEPDGEAKTEQQGDVVLHEVRYRRHLE